MLKHHIRCQPAFQHIVCHQSKTNPYQRPPPVLDWSYLVHLPLTGKCSKKSQFVAQIFHFSIEDKTYKSKHICLCGVVCQCGHESGVSPWFPAGITGCSLTCSTPSLHRKRAYQRTRKRHCVSCQHTSLNASNIICGRGKNPKTKQNGTKHKDRE